MFAVVCRGCYGVGGEWRFSSDKGYDLNYIRKGILISRKGCKNWDIIVYYDGVKIFPFRGYLMMKTFIKPKLP